MLGAAEGDHAELTCVQPGIATAKHLRYAGDTDIMWLADATARGSSNFAMNMENPYFSRPPGGLLPGAV